MTLQQFSTIFALLATQLRATDADAATIRGYYSALKDLEIEFLSMAAQQLARTGEWFPKTSEWRAAATRVERERTEKLRIELGKRLEPLCAACRDTGWEPSGEGVRRCECLRLRRLEVLGRRPWPTLPAASWPTVVDTEITRNEAPSVVAMIQQRTGKKLRPRGMPETWSSRNARREDQRRAETD